MTNHERIKSMSVEETAEMIYNATDIRKDEADCAYCPAYECCTTKLSCKEEIKRWLNSEVEE